MLSFITAVLLFLIFSGKLAPKIRDERDLIIWLSVNFVWLVADMLSAKPNHQIDIMIALYIVSCVFDFSKQRKKTSSDTERNEQQ